LKRKGVLALALALAAILIVGAAVAFAAKRYTTKIVYLGNGGSSISDVTIYGDLNSNAKCVGARSVGLFKKTAQGYKLIDADLSSFNGAWALRADLTGTPDLAIQVTKEKRKHGDIVCKPAAITLSPNSQSYPR
jgi:hypothetical protein